MQIDPKQTKGSDNYKLLTNLVVPRPIAWITSIGASGVVNLAPFSFFNAVSSSPLFLAVSIGRNDDGGVKDSARNIAERGEFVVNLVTPDLIDAMNVSAADFPSGESELDAAGLHAAASSRIAVPRVAECAASMECTLHQSVPLGGNTLFIGEVVMFHVADHLVGERHHINGFAPIGRLGSPSMYCRTDDRFDLARLSYAKWKGEKGQD